MSEAMRTPVELIDEALQDVGHSATAANRGDDANSRLLQVRALVKGMAAIVSAIEAQQRPITNLVLPAEWTAGEVAEFVRRSGQPER